MVIAIRAPEIFTSDFFEKLRDLHDALEEEVPHLEEVRSLINARVTRGEDDELVIEDLLENWPESDEEWAAVSDYARGNPFYHNLLLGESGSFTVVTVQTSAYSSEGFAADGDLEALEFGFDAEIVEAARSARDSSPGFITGRENGEAVRAVESIIERFESTDFRLDLAGSPVLQSDLMTELQANMQRFLGLMMLVIVALLYALYRRISGVILPLVSVLPAVAGTIGSMAIAGEVLSAPSQILPSLLLAVGVGSAIHIQTIFFQRFDQGDSREDSIAYALGHSGLPVCMSSLTTIGGMLSFVTAPVAPISAIGVFAPLGISLALINCLVLLPALLLTVPMKSRATESSAAAAPGRIEQLLIAMGGFSIRHARAMVSLAAVLTIVSLIGASRIRFGHDIMAWLPVGHSVRVATEVFDAELNGSMSLEIQIDTGRENGLHEPELLRNLDALATEIEALSAAPGLGVGKTVSFIDVLKEIHSALNADRDEFYAVPQDRQLIAQELLLFENSGADDLEDLVDSRFSKARFTIRVPYVDPIAYVPFVNDVVDRFETRLGEGVEIVATGFLGVISRTISALITSMVRSYILALVIITPLMMLLLGSLRTGLASMVPNLTPIIIVLGLMGWFGIVMDVFTLMIGGIAIGLAVDDTIHYMHNFRRYFGRYGDVRRASDETLRTTGHALLVTSLVLSSGFFIYIFAEMNNLFYFGLLTSLTIAIAFLVDILVSPALMALAYRGRGRGQGS